MTVFLQALGGSFQTLPTPVQAFHNAGNRCYQGFADSAGDFHFNVTATAFMAGRLIRYQGSLKPQ
jgi:hypothetical protein